jgi:hypothetical protein
MLPEEFYSRKNEQQATNADGEGGFTPQLRHWTPFQRSSHLGLANPTPANGSKSHFSKSCSFSPGNIPLD